MSERRVMVQKIDGILTIMPSKTVSAQDIIDYLNKEPNRKPLEFYELDEKWTGLKPNDA